MGKRKDYVMSPSELQNLKEEIRESESVLKVAEDYGRGTRASEMLDKNALKANISRCDKLLQQYSPGKMRGATKDKVAKRAKELAAKIQEGMPTRGEMVDPRRYPGAPYKNLKWEKTHKAHIHEWKQCQRRLNPGDPTCSSVERLRK